MWREPWWARGYIGTTKWWRSVGSNFIRIPISQCPRKKNSTNELELLAVVWAVDRYKHYLLGKPFIIATDHKALTSALDGNKSNKTYQSCDQFDPVGWPVIAISVQYSSHSGVGMGIVDYLSRDPFNDPWPESELDEKFVVATINSFHEALDCMNSRLKETGSLDRNENVLECSRRNAKKQSSTNGCFATKMAKNEQSSTGTRENSFHDCKNS